jgi:hypothetical protein
MAQEDRIVARDIGFGGHFLVSLCGESAFFVGEIARAIRPSTGRVQAIDLYVNGN